MKYYQYNQWQTIDDNIDYSQGIQTTSRIDDAFETCTFKAYLTNNLPIPPYTLFKDGSALWVGKSRITQYLTENNLYVHEFELLEPSAFLKCFIIGVKVYSKESPTWSEDSEKVKSLLAQAQRMYPDYTFDYGSITNRIRTSKTYTFSATDTLYDCLNQICQENDVKLVVTFEDDDPYKLVINFKSVVYGTYNINASGLRIINHTENQDAENYGRFLETYASNVVDRTTITRCEYIRTKADDVLLNADTAKVFTPTAIESVTDFGIRQGAFNGSITIKGLNNYFDTPFTIPTNRTYGELAESIQCQIGSETVYFFDYIYENEIKTYFINKTAFYNTATFDNTQPDWSAGTITFRVPSSLDGKFTKMSALLEKTQWDALTPQDQAGRLFYTIGGNTIENLNGSYKNDLWNIIIGQSRGNFLSAFKTCSNYMLNGNIEAAYFLDRSGTGANNLVNMVFFIDYNAITNPYIRDKKTDSSYNEYSFKPISRSYGVSANYIDFDKIIPNMTISNNTLGQIEKVYEIDLTGVTDASLNNPQAGNTVTISSGSWYISSCIRTKKFSGAKDTAVLTIVKNYSKKAESIGVDSQEESTNNPLHGITTRPIYLEYKMPSGADFSMFDSSAWYLKMVFYDNNDNVISNTVNGTTQSDLYIRCSVQKYNNVVYLYTETLDQMILDYARGAAQTDYTELVPCLYTDSKAESGYVAVSFGIMTSLSIADYNLPMANGSYFQVYDNLAKVRIDKDAREHLTFTLKLYK